MTLGVRWDEYTPDTSLSDDARDTFGVVGVVHFTPGCRRCSSTTTPSTTCTRRGRRRRTSRSRWGRGCFRRGSRRARGEDHVSHARRAIARRRARRRERRAPRRSTLPTVLVASSGDAKPRAPRGRRGRRARSPPTRKRPRASRPAPSGPMTSSTVAAHGGSARTGEPLSASGRRGKRAAVDRRAPVRVGVGGDDRVGETRLPRSACRDRRQRARLLPLGRTRAARRRTASRARRTPRRPRGRSRCRGRSRSTPAGRCFTLTQSRPKKCASAPQFVSARSSGRT